MATQELIIAADTMWNGLRKTTEDLSDVFHTEFQLQGFPGPKVRISHTHEEAPAEAESDAEAQSHIPTPEAGISYLRRFFGEGRGLTNLVYFVDGAQVLGETGVAQCRWIAEHGLGDAGSPRYVSGRVALTFHREDEGWKVRGWLGSRGLHQAVDGAHRADDVQAIREQILRVFEAYRQKDLGVLRRTHTADWRGFTVTSNTVGRGIDAYIQAAEGAVGSTQFEEYQILDLAPIFYGDVAIVPYVARIAGRNRQGRVEAYRLRVLDVYVREPMGWNQVATNTSLHPEEMIGG